MKQVFVICIFLLYLLGYVSSEAKASITIAKAENRKESSRISPFSSHQDDPANITQTYYFHYITGKASGQRILPDYISQDELNNRLRDQLGKYSNTDQLLTCVPLIRLLLFPKHYFW